MCRLFPDIRVICLVAFVLVACSQPSLRVQRGDELMKAEMYEQALEEYQQAVEAEPDDPDLKARVKQVRKLLVERAVQECRALLELNEYDSALIAFSGALHHGTGETGMLKDIGELANQFLQGGKTALKNGDTREAFFLTNQMLEYLGAHQGYGHIEESIRRAWAGELYRLAVDWQQRQFYGNSLVSIALIKRLVGSYQSSAELESKARAHMQNVARSNVELQAASVPKKLLISTRQVIDRLRLTVGSRCPSLSFEATGRPKFRVQLGVHKIGIISNREISKLQQKYRSGTQKVDNPEIFELKSKITDGKNRIVELEARLDQDAEGIRGLRQAFADAGPEDDEETLRNRLLQAEAQQQEHRAKISELGKQVRRLRRTLSRTPRKLHEPVYSMHTFSVTKITKTAQAHASMIAWNEKDKRLWSEKLMGSSSASDTTNPAKPRYGVKADPLRFEKTDEVLRGETLNNIAAKAVEQLDRLCQQLEMGLLEKIRNTPPDKAQETIELITLYIFVTGEPPTKEMKDFMERERAFKDFQVLMIK